MNNLEWQPRACNYENERRKIKVEMITANQHPLQPRAAPKAIVVTMATPPAAPSSSSSKTSAADPLGGMDPLSAMMMDPLSDPLSAMMMADAVATDPLSVMTRSDGPMSQEMAAAVAEEKRKQANDTSQKEDLRAHKEDLNVTWETRKKLIYSEYNVEGTITMSSAAYNDFDGSGVDDGSRTRLIDKYSQRLAGLEQRKLNKDTVIITQKQFEQHVHKLHDDLETAWKREERQQSLKIVIQLAKLLADTQHPQFYPCMFVLVTDVLEKFSDMVYRRLKEKAEETTGKLKDDFTLDDVPVTARETSRNWFYKVACIVELLPRLLVEITLLKCYRFLTDTEYPQILARLGSIARGLGDPLVSTYARTFLVYTASTVVSHDRVSKLGFAMTQDMMYSFKMLRDTHHQVELVRCGIPEDQYVRLMSPGVQWMMKQVGKNATKELFQSMLQHYRQHCNDAMVLGHIIEAFDASHYAHGSLGMVALIKSAIESFKTTSDVFADFGKQLAAFPPPEEQRMAVLNEVWKVVSKAGSGDKLASYVRCSAVWMELAQRHYTERELLILLSDLTAKLGEVEGELSDDILRVLENILSSLLGKSGTFGTTVLTSEHLLKIMDMFKGPRKVNLCMDVLDAFRRTHTTTGDAVLINTMIDIGRNLHDSIDMLSSEGDRRHISKLLNGFIGKIDFGKDLEQQLNTYVECRAIFCNLDMVKDKLVVGVIELAHRAYTIMHGTHSKKTAAFTKACLAYCHITIPSIRSVSRKLELLLHCANCALLNQCLPQTDTFLKAAITLIPEMPPNEEVDGKRVHTETRLAAYLSSLLSTLVLVPGHPDHGPFYIVQGLLNAVPKYPWQAHTGAQTRVYINMLALLATYAQKKFPYSLPHVESNDVLYCSAPGYAFDLAQQTSRCVEEILKQLTALGETAATNSSAKTAQARLVLDTINQITCRMELNKGVGDLLVKMLGLANTHRSSFGNAETAYFRNTVVFVEATANNSPNAAKLPPQLRSWPKQ